MRRALAACLLSACGATPAPPAPPPAALPVPAVSEAPVDEPPAPPPAQRAPRGRKVEPSAAELEEPGRLARALRAVVSNVDPRPVERGFTKTTTVQYRTDRRTPGVFGLVESPSMALHHPPSPAETDEPCRRPLAPGGRVRGVLGLGAELRVVGEAHELWLDRAKPRRVDLPPGASHGACLGPDGTRLWVSWSTRASPPELLSISLRDGNTRPLRADARPQLAWVASRAAPRAGKKVTLATHGSTSAWSPLVALLQARGLDVERVRAADGEPERVVVGERVVVLAAVAGVRCDGATTLVGWDEAALAAAADDGDCAWTLAVGDDPVPDAWARVAALSTRD